MAERSRDELIVKLHSDAIAYGNYAYVLRHLGRTELSLRLSAARGAILNLARQLSAGKES